jgi:hypothetical protein
MARPIIVLGLDRCWLLILTLVIPSASRPASVVASLNRQGSEDGDCALRLALSRSAILKGKQRALRLLAPDADILEQDRGPMSSVFPPPIVSTLPANEYQ